jgi:D-alanyl-D-alanine carboxypeptidase
MRRTVYIFLAIFVLIGIGMGIWAYRFVKPSSERALQFITENPDNFSIHYIRNGNVVLSHNDELAFDLATVPDLLALVELSAQIAEKQISANDSLRFDRLRRHQIKGTDGGSFLIWEERTFGKDLPERLTINELAQGVSQYGSSAHTSLLFEILGIENINQRTRSLNLEEQEEFFYYPSSMFMWQKSDMQNEEDHLATLQALSDEKYWAYSEEFHTLLGNDSTGEFSESLGRLGYDQLRIWSDRLPKGASKDYANLMWRIMKGESDSSLSQVHYLQNLLEWPMKVGANKDLLKTAGMKGGSTPFVLAKTFYAWDLEDNQSAICYSFRGMTPVQTVRLQLSMNEFEKDLLKDEEFRSVLSSLLNTN